MNNANFGFDCRNNINNAKFVPIIDEINEIFYIKKYYNLFYPKVLSFVNSNLLGQEIKQSFQQQLAEVKYNHPFRNARITALENQNREELDLFEALQKKERRSKKRKLAVSVGTILILTKNIAIAQNLLP